MIKQGFGLKGYVILYQNGEKIYEGENLVVEDGRAEVAKAIAGESIDMPIAMALGSDSSSVSSTDSSLGDEFYRDGIDDISRSDTTVTFDHTFSPGEGTGTVAEIGLFSSEDDESGTMFARITPVERNKQANDELTVVWSIQVEAEES